MDLKAGPLHPVEFSDMSGELRGIVWQVTMQEDGSLAIYLTGRRNGRILIEPSSNTSIIATSGKIIASKPNP